jgi:hypothetical protein
MENPIPILQQYVDYSKDKSNSLAMGHIWSSKDFSLILDKLNNKKLSKITTAFFNYFLPLNRIKNKEIALNYSKTRLLRIVGAANTKSKTSQQNKFRKIWDTYTSTFLARYEIKSALRNIDNEYIIAIIDYLKDWKSPEARTKCINHDFDPNNF